NRGTVWRDSRRTPAPPPSTPTARRHTTTAHVDADSSGYVAGTPLIRAAPNRHRKHVAETGGDRIYRGYDAQCCWRASQDILSNNLPCSSHHWLVPLRQGICYLGPQHGLF